MQHLETSAIMDLILKLVTQVEGNDIRQNILNVRSHTFKVLSTNNFKKQNILFFDETRFVCTINVAGYIALFEI